MTCRASRSPRHWAANCLVTVLRAPGHKPTWRRSLPGGDNVRREGLGRSVRLLRLLRSEQTDPEQYYTLIADDAVRQVAGYCELPGRTVLDVGGGGGWFTAAFRAHGARCCLFEPDRAELYLSLIHISEPTRLGMIS